jgi:hypothetical protein
MREMRGRDKGIKGAKEINEERGRGMTNVVQKKGIRKRAKNEGEKLRNEVNKSPWNFYVVLQ